MDEPKVIAAANCHRRLSLTFQKWRRRRRRRLTFYDFPTRQRQKWKRRQGPSLKNYVTLSQLPEEEKRELIFKEIEVLSERFPEAAGQEQWFDRLETAEDVKAAVDQIAAELEPVNAEDFQTPPTADQILESNASADIPGFSGGNVQSVRYVGVRRQGSGQYVDFLSDTEKEGLQTILQMFPDVDPYFVVVKIAHEGQSAEDIVDSMTKDSSYPKMKNRLQKERRERRREEFLNPEKFDAGVYLRIFEDPEAYFMNRERQVSSLYVKHCEARLMNEFRHMRRDFVKQVMSENGNLYLPTYRAIQETVLGHNYSGIGRGKKLRGTKRKTRPGGQFLQQDRTEMDPWPEEIEEIFFRELQFVVYEQEIKDYKANKVAQREQRLEWARERGVLEECQCCCLDEFLPEEMVWCKAVKHRFCSRCVRQHAETQIGEGQYKVRCLSGECEEEVGLEVLGTLLQPNTVDLVVRRRQEQEIQEAHLENMDSCPFCNFVMIIENLEDKVFQCQNPECLKESCRQCKEESHVPLKCEEVEKADETRMRIFVENKMAEAMIRKCPKCGKRLIKGSGCNKMTCACGAYFCYVCNELLDKRNLYAHFGNGAGVVMVGLDRVANGAKSKEKRCPQMTTMDQVHADVAESAGREAKEQYLKEHPELQEKKDVKVDELVDRLGAGHPLNFDDDDYDSDDSDEGLIGQHDDPYVVSDADASFEDEDERPVDEEYPEVPGDGHPDDSGSIVSGSSTTTPEIGQEVEVENDSEYYPEEESSGSSAPSEHSEDSFDEGQEAVDYFDAQTEEIFGDGESFGSSSEPEDGECEGESSEENQELDSEYSLEDASSDSCSS